MKIKKDKRIEARVSAYYKSAFNMIADYKNMSKTELLEDMINRYFLSLIHI